MDFRKDIQGLRALAFLLVFVFHLNSQWLPGGFIGVDVFFVISGFLMTSIILSQKEKGTFNFYNFFEKRIKRIVPAQFVMLLIVAFFGFYMYLYTDLALLRKWLLSSAMFFSNAIFANNDNYFGANSTQNPVLHTWSLSIEMQFYLFLPIMLFFIKNKYLKKVVILLISLLVIYSSVEIWQNGIKPSLYFSFIARVPEFLVGAFFSITFKDRKLSKNVSVLMSIIGLLMIFFSAILINESSFFPGIIALIPCIGASLLLISSETFITQIFSNKISVYIGELSYSLYLWHWPIMALLRYSNDEYLFSVQEMIGITFLTVLLGWLSYTFVETYFRSKNNRAFVKYFAPIVVLVLVFPFFLLKIGIFKKIPSEFVDPFFFGEKSSINLDEKPVFEKFGDIERNDKILLIGDSNAGALKAFFDNIGKKSGFSFKTINTNTYPPIKGLKKEDVSFDDINPNQYEALEKAKNVASFISNDVAQSKVIIIVCTKYDRISSEKNGIVALAKNLKKDQKLLIIKSFPKIKNNINAIKINRGIVKNTDKILYSFSYNFPKEIQELPAKRDNVFIYDISKSKVFKDTPYYNDTIIYYDGGHINYYGQMVLAKDLNKDFGYFMKNTVLK